MDDLLSEFGALKLSALSKSIRLNHYAGDITIGPQAVRKKPVESAVAITRKKITSPSNEGTNRNIAKIAVSPIKVVLSEIEQERKQKVEEAVCAHRDKIINFRKQQDNVQKQQWCQNQQRLLRQMQEQEYQIIKALEQHDIESSKKQEKLIQYYQQLARRRKENDDAIRAKEQYRQQINNMINNISKTQQNFKAIYMDIIQILKGCNEEVNSIISHVIRNLKELSPQMDEIISKCKEGNVCEQDMVKGVKLLQIATQLKDEVVQKVVDYNKRQEVMKESKKAEEVKHEEEKARQAAQIKKDEPQITAVEPAFNPIVSKDAVKTYSELQVYLQKHQESYKSLLEDASIKNFKFDCKKGVNIPVNALSAVSRKHLQDKYLKLQSLLAGKLVQLGDTQIVASRHPKGIAFCMDLLAKKFVLQGDLMISSNPEAAFYYASVIVTLWNEFPDFGTLMLAHLHKQCPYLIPIYLPKYAEQSDEEYYKSLGYQYQDGAIEKQDKFLKRMSGIFRLYFSILIARPKSGHNKHPQDLSNAWHWITSILNLEPKTDITATGIHVFLEVLGSAMERMYKKQFKKIINVITNQYVFLLKKCDSGGPFARLELLLSEYREKGHFEEPNGILPANFW